MHVIDAAVLGFGHFEGQEVYFKLLHIITLYHFLQIHQVIPIAFGVYLAIAGAKDLADHRTQVPLVKPADLPNSGLYQLEWALLPLESGPVIQMAKKLKVVSDEMSIEYLLAHHLIHNEPFNVVEQSLSQM